MTPEQISLAGDIAQISAIDHHCHPLLRGQQQMPLHEFRTNFTESFSAEIGERHVPHTIYYRWAIRELGRLLNCAPEEKAVFARRQALDEQSYIALLLAEAHLDTLLIDGGFPPGDKTLSPEETGALMGCETHRVLRLETLAERLLLSTQNQADFTEALLSAIQNARSQGIVSFKSIAAYRCGLSLQPTTRQDAQAALQQAQSEAHSAGKLRLSNPTVIAYLVTVGLQEAAKQELPVQFHTGFGDPDLDLRTANPLHLRPFFADSRFKAARLIMLHAGYPYVRQGAYLAAVYPNAYLDLSLAIPFTAGDMPAVVREALGLAPASKLLWSSDAFNIPEHYWLGSILGRRALAIALDELINLGALDRVGAIDIATRLLRGTARELYELT